MTEKKPEYYSPDQPIPQGAMDAMAWLDDKDEGLEEALNLLRDARIRLGEDGCTYLIDLPADWCPRVLALLESYGA